jgi:thiamine-phosphate pyrophosphorylase
MHDNLKGLYVLSDDSLTPPQTILEQMKEVLEFGVRIIQLRDKTRSDNELEPIARDLQSLCKDFGATLIINDRINLAQKIGADGVHIGIEDGSLHEARLLLPRAIIGVSCYGDLDRAKEAVEGGADYVAFGSFFPSPTKPHSKTVPLEVIRRAKEELSVPICVIGGINNQNIHLVKESDMISIVSAAYTPNSISQNLASLQKAIS